MKTKVCGTCKKRKPVTGFTKNLYRKDGLNNKCRICYAEYMRGYYVTHKAEHIERARRSKIKRKSKIMEALHRIKKACSICGEDRTACLDFHHRDRKKKSFTVSNAINWGYSVSRIMKEVEKCDVVCANCHRILELESRQLRARRSS